MGSSALRVAVRHFDGMRLPSSQAEAIVVIDVLRATTVIVCALAHGAAEIVPVTDVESARSLARSIGGALLGGEQDNEKPDGFDFGNSPQEYDARVRDRTVILRTTNGTRVLEAFRGRTPVWCGAFANAGSIAHAVAAPNVEAATFVCAGQAGAFSLEDYACAGAFLDALVSLRDVVCDDEAIAARELFAGHKGDLAALLRNGNHARALQRANHDGDVDFAARLDRYDVLPALVDGRIVASSFA